MSVAFNCYYSDPEQLVTLWLKEKAKHVVPDWASALQWWRTEASEKKLREVPEDHNAMPW